MNQRLGASSLSFRSAAVAVFQTWTRTNGAMELLETTLRVCIAVSPGTGYVAGTVYSKFLEHAAPFPLVFEDTS